MKARRRASRQDRTVIDVYLGEGASQRLGKLMEEGARMSVAARSRGRRLGLWPASASSAMCRSPSSRAACGPDRPQRPRQDHAAAHHLRPGAAPRAARSASTAQRIDRLRPDEIVAAGIVHVPQGDLLFPEMTVLENLRMGAYLPRPPQARGSSGWRRSSRCCPSCKERRDQIASTLSGGERRMVGIGRGLMAGGKLLMLDEPSLGLAPIVIDQIYAVIRRCAHRAAPS